MAVGALATDPHTDPGVDRMVDPTVEDRVIDAALECFGRWGIAKTTAEDIGREAGVSRATVYRSFPGGKGAILHAVGQREIGRLMGAVLDAVDGADDLEALLVGGIVAASTELRDHHALNFLIRHEPEAVLPYLAFDRLDVALDLTRSVCAPVVARFVRPAVAAELVEWATRMVLSLTFAPGFVDPTSPAQVRHLVRRLLLPGFADEILSPVPGAPVPSTVPSTAKDMP